MAEMTASSITADAPISLQQRLQQALAADIGSPGAAAKQASSLQRQAAGVGSGTGSEADSVREEDTGFWDLVYILYPDFAEAAGVGPLRELVPHWTLLEKTLMVSSVALLQPAAQNLLSVTRNSSSCHDSFDHLYHQPWKLIAV